jgi:hypothetical protein
MAEHGHPGWYSWVVVLGGNLATLLLTVMVVLTINQRSIDRERAARLAGERAACAVVDIYVRAAQEAPQPTTAYGKEIVDSMRTLRAALRCP